MKRILRLWLSLLTLPLLAEAQTAMTTTRVYVPQGTMDGVSVGDTDGDSLKEIALVSRGGTYNATSLQTETGRSSAPSGTPAA